MIEQDLRTYLLAQAPVSALIGTRIFPLRLPQGVTLPAVTYQRISGVPVISHDGASDLARARIQVDCWAASYAAMAGLAMAIRTALSGYRGPMGNNGATAARVINQIDLSEPEPALWRRMIDVAIWHREDS